MDADLYRLGLDLDTIRYSGLTPRRVARLLLTQPGGAEVWQEIGGWRALPDALLASMQVQHAIVSVNSEKPPKPPKPPIGRIAEREQKRQVRERFARGAETFQARFNTGDMRAEFEKRVAAWPAAWRRGMAGDRINADRAARLADWNRDTPRPPIVQRPAPPAIEPRADGPGGA